MGGKLGIRGLSLKLLVLGADAGPAEVASALSDFLTDFPVSRPLCRDL